MEQQYRAWGHLLRGRKCSILRVVTVAHVCIYTKTTSNVPISQPLLLLLVSTKDLQVLFSKNSPPSPSKWHRHRPCSYPVHDAQRHPPLSAASLSCLLPVSLQIVWGCFPAMVQRFDSIWPTKLKIVTNWSLIALTDSQTVLKHLVQLTGVTSPQKHLLLVGKILQYSLYFSEYILHLCITYSTLYTIKNLIKYFPN